MGTMRNPGMGPESQGTKYPGTIPGPSWDDPMLGGPIVMLCNFHVILRKAKGQVLRVSAALHVLIHVLIQVLNDIKKHSASDTIYIQFSPTIVQEGKQTKRPVRSMWVLYQMLNSHEYLDVLKDKEV